MFFFLPQIRQQTSAIPPSRMAPPIPPTTPPIMPFDFEERPVAVPSPPLEDKMEGVVVIVAKPVVELKTVRDVDVMEDTLPSIVVRIVVTS